MNATHGKRQARSPAKLIVPREIPILDPETIETLHEWEDVDGDALRALCSRGETLGVD